MNLHELKNCPNPNIQGIIQLNFTADIEGTAKLQLIYENT